MGGVDAASGGMQSLSMFLVHQKIGEVI